MLNGIKCYVAGPYSGDPDANTEAAIAAGEKLMRLGYVAFIPHLSHFWHGQHEHEYHEWLEWCLEWVKVCDVVLRLPGDSSGADIETELAGGIDIPVYHSITALHQDYLDGLL